MSWSKLKRQCRPLHSQDDIDYRSGCMKKKRYTANDEAEMNSVMKSMQEKYNKRFNVYSCRFCEGKHIGSLDEGLD